MNVDAEKLAKLPKWARDHIAEQGREIARLQHQVQTTSGEDYETPVRWQDVIQPGTKPLPRHAVLSWRIGKQEGWGSRVTINLNHEGDQIEIRGDVPIEILPLAANAINVGLRPR